MREEPEIVKELREEERLRNLKNKQNKIFYFQELEGEEGSDEEDEHNNEDFQDFSSLQLESLKQNYMSIFENYFVAITIADEKERIVSWNKYAEKILKMTEKDLFLRNVKTLYPDEEWKKIREENIRKKGMKHKLETKMLKKNGEIFDVEVSVCVLKGEGGKTTGSIGFIKDNSKLKSTERKLLDTAEKYKTIFENSAVGIMVTDENECVISWNKYAEKLLGMNEEELHLKPIKEFYTTKEWERIRAENIRKKGIKHHFETKIKTKNKSLLDVDISISVLKNHKGEVVGSIGVIKDITEQKIIENNLINSEKKFRGIFDATSDFILYFEDDLILDINDNALKLSGIKKENLLGKEITELKGFFSKADMEKHINAIKSIYNDVKVKDYESDLKAVDGNIYRFLFTVDCIKEDDEIIGVLLRGRDITQRQRAWDELVKLEEKYRILAETSADGVITVDPMGRITYVNPAFEKMIKRRKGQILATLFREYMSEDSVYFFEQVFVDVRKKDEKIEHVELELVHSSGDLIPIEVNIAPLKKNKDFVGIVCSIRDITERRKVENELKKSERLKTEFMNIAAHELKSPVTPIKGYLELIIADKEADDKIKNWAKISLRNSERLLRLVNDILDVSRLDTDTMRFEMVKLDSTQILDEVAEDMKPAVEKKNLKFITKIPRDLPGIMGDRHRLSQVFKNLLGNALKFTDNGSISIEAEKKKDHILISIKDTGIGISDEEVKKVFTKFYQAYSGDDRKNEGVGLGLFICREIIRKHNGDIWVESQIRKGSTFYVKLPYLHKMVLSL
jgi:PAS domain S-box-containing protein